MNRIGMYSLYWPLKDQLRLTLASRGQYMPWSTRFPFPRVLMADTAWFEDRAFRNYLERGKNQGMEVWGLQHGGRYGMVHRDDIWQEREEFKMADRWFGWGWTRDYAPSPRMVFPLRQDRPRSEILFFAGSLPSEINHTWRADLQRYIPEMKIREYPRKRSRKEYLQTLDRIRLAIPEYCGTVLLETLAANVPTMVTWDERTRIRESAKPYMEILRSAGIFHRSPMELAGFIRQVDIEEWWALEHTQKARQVFVHQFARSQQDWMEPWLKLSTTL